jgi:hypothetical protein
MRRRNRSLLTAAGRGAVAGLVGGLALTATDRVIAPRVAGVTPRGRKFDDRIARSARAVGVRIPKRRREPTGVLATLACASLLGAAYGVARTRLGRFGLGRSAVDAALGYGASLLLPESRGTPRSPRATTPQGLLARKLDDPQLYERVTIATYRILSR